MNLSTTEFQVNILGSACWKEGWRHSLSDSIQTGKHSPGVQNELVILVFRTKSNLSTLICYYVTRSQCTHFISDLITASVYCFHPLLRVLVFHIYSFHILFLFIFCIPPHPPSTICSNTLLPSTEPQALAHVVMSYGSSTEAWELPPLLDANTMSIKQLWHWCHPLFVILPFSLFCSLHSLSRLIHCEGFVDTFSRAEAGEGVRG